MPPDDSDLHEEPWCALSELLLGSFGATEALASVSDRRRDLETFLRNQIRSLLRDNPARLMAILYRVDVSEHEVMECFKRSDGEALVKRLSDLVITRQLEKLETRRRFRSSSQ